MDLIKQAREKLENASENTILYCFDVIGNEYLEGEQVYLNNEQEIYELIIDFELLPNEIVAYLITDAYKQKDKYIIFDGQTLETINDLDYCKQMISKKMNNEIAKYILENEK